MGIPELWNKLGDGEITSLARLSADCFTCKGRSFRVAIDEAGWRFNNLNEAQVHAIQQKSNQPAYRGIEKNTFYRLAKLLQKNVQPLFVFDGPGRPWKKGRPPGRVDYEKTKLLKQLLAVLKIPYHEAPGEAEAECARLQMEGVVDAVWSEDADTLMFGCEFLIRDYRISHKKPEAPASGCKSDTKKSKDFVRVYRMEQVRRSLGIDREGIVCFTVLAGGDYDNKGLPGCGASNALKAARHGLGKSLCAYKSKEDLAAWRSELSRFFQGKFETPAAFPPELAVQHYCHPKVSPVERLHDLRGLRQGWDAPLDEERVRVFISERFNMWTKSYMEWIGPILLVRSLIGTPSGRKINKHDVRLARTRKRKADDEEASEAPTLDTEVKLTFLATSVSYLQYNTLDDGHWTGTVGIPHEPEYRVECEVVDSFLRSALPDEVLQRPVSKQAASKSKKRAAEMADGEKGSEKRAKLRNPSAKENGVEPAKKRGRPKKAELNGTDSSMPAPAPAPKAVFRYPKSVVAFSEPPFQPTAEALTTYTSQNAPVAITPPGLEDDSSEDDPYLGLALALSRREDGTLASTMRSPLVRSLQSPEEKEAEAIQLRIAMELSRKETQAFPSYPQLRNHLLDVTSTHSTAANPSTRLSHTKEQLLHLSTVKSSAMQIEPSPAQLRAARLAHFQNAASAAADTPQAPAHMTTPLRHAVVIDLTDD